MVLCTKRKLVFSILIFPAFVYLILIFVAIGQICLKTDFDETRLKEKYLTILHLFQERSQDFHNGLGHAIGVDVKGIGRHLHNENHNVSSLRHVTSSNRGFINKNVPPSGLLYNCPTISGMKIRSKVGHGVSKQAFIADYQGTKVAIKMVTRHIHEVKNCLERFKRPKPTQDYNNNDSETSITKTFGSGNTKTTPDSSFKSIAVLPDVSVNQIPAHSEQLNVALTKSSRVNVQERQRCYTFSTAKLMKEILLSEQLQHHNLARLLGYCVRSEESDSSDISEHGVISVYEFGTRFVLDNLQILPWQTRLQHAIEMADLLTYLQYSPLGSLVVPDFKEGHLVMINGSLKLIDLDDVNNLEPECDARKGKDTSCPYKIRCQRALCEGFNAKENLKNMNSLVFKRLLFPLTFPQSIMAQIGQINAQLDSLTLTAADLKRQLESIQLYLSKERM